ncbi:translocation-enhancing protein TepA [Candidatus Epulonipiscium fishelsonii]|uniref:Translocation-enhancing protein TepA n=1 Tax=Candidatus Epulonipiscium fishelsonii TaxID=77094 RepID=A0ACC8XBD7_9FIRM|nr:translocation-enhancing protein TepA [Epulopiscium sp. SCG-B05WGA-EpuloA1]ONI39854.1 translocation-enhancing protein TepA [Epulopiscium sp. SCG-B11WGA-EpuloA1]
MADESIESMAAEIDQTTKQIKEMGQVPPQFEKSNIHCVTIIGQIEGHVTMSPQNKTTKYEHLIPQFVAFSEDNAIKGILLVLNTIGGDVEAGLALAELIASFDKPVVTLVLGGAHSISVPIAVSGDYSFITPSATMTLHPVRMNGTILGVVQSFEYFDQMQERIVEFVASNSEISADRFRELMLAVGKIAKDMGTILQGQQAVSEKLINEVGGLHQAMTKLKQLIKEREEQN